MSEKYIGCIDGTLLEVRAKQDEVILSVGRSEARMSVEAAGRLADLLGRLDRERQSREPSKHRSGEKSRRKSRARKYRSRHYPVKIHDLIKAGYLDPYSILTFHRGNQVHEALVTNDGKLLVGDSEFSSPSGAAKHAAGTTTEPGWALWRLNGEPLASLRWKLLAERFPGERLDWSEEYINDKRRAATRWVAYALANNLDPGISNETALEDHFTSLELAESTRTLYRHHLRQWFEEYGPQEVMPQ